MRREGRHLYRPRFRQLFCFARLSRLGFVSRGSDLVPRATVIGQPDKNVAKDRHPPSPFPVAALEKTTGPHFSLISATFSDRDLIAGHLL